MFKIHPKQMAACAEVSTQSFADRITHHLVGSAPSPCEALGASAVQGMVERGIADAASHGITARKDVCLFLAATSALGEGFAADPKLPWAADLLGADNPLDPSAKVQQLWAMIASDILLEDAVDASPSVALAVELSEAAKTDLAGPLPVSRPVVPCPLRPRCYPFSV